jgi:hypothetical protein
MENNNDVVLYLLELKKKYKNKFYMVLKAIVLFSSYMVSNVLFDFDFNEAMEFYLMLQCLNELERQNILSKIDEELELYEDLVDHEDTEKKLVRF